MDSLHLCNLANVAYGYCKILAEAGRRVDLRCHDLKHLMSQPEWDDLELNSEDFLDENDFTVNRADFGDYRRPAWFQQAPIFPEAPPLLAPLGSKVLPKRVRIRLRPLYRRALQKRHALVHLLKRMMPEWFKRPLRGGYQRLRHRMSRAVAPPPLPAEIPQQVSAAEMFERIERERFAGLVELSRQYGPEWELTHDMLLRYRPHACWLERHLAGHEVTMAYVLTPIYAMLHGRTPYVSIEIGTMRDIPFDGTDAGKLLAMAYRLSDHILITNPDVVTAADRLGLRREQYSFCPHPVDEDKYCGSDAGLPLREELRRRHNADLILFAPARQNWAIKGNDRYFRAFAELLRHDVRAALVVPGWGQEIARSRQLCRDLGIEGRVVWMPPVSELKLVKYYQASDLVLDQFELGVFGLVTCKALSCARPVLTSYSPDMHAWCFDEHPPIVGCRTEKEIFDAMLGLAQSPERRRQIGEQSRRWVEQYHSKRVVRGILEDAMGRARDHYREKSCRHTAARKSA